MRRVRRAWLSPFEALYCHTNFRLDKVTKNGSGEVRYVWRTKVAQIIIQKSAPQISGTKLGGSGIQPATETPGRNLHVQCLDVALFAAVTLFVAAKVFEAVPIAN